MNTIRQHGYLDGYLYKQAVDLSPGALKNQAVEMAGKVRSGLNDAQTFVKNRVPHPHNMSDAEVTGTSDFLDWYAKNIGSRPSSPIGSWYSNTDVPGIAPRQTPPMGYRRPLQEYSKSPAPDPEWVARYKQGLPNTYVSTVSRKPEDGVRASMYYPMLDSIRTNLTKPTMAHEGVHPVDPVLKLPLSYIGVDDPRFTSTQKSTAVSVARSREPEVAAMIAEEKAADQLRRQTNWDPDKDRPPHWMQSYMRQFHGQLPEDPAKWGEYNRGLLQALRSSPQYRQWLKHWMTSPESGQPSELPLWLEKWLLPKEPDR